MEESQFHVLIKHYFLMRRNIVWTEQWLHKYYGESFLLRQIVAKWIGEFKQVCTSTNDAERSGRPKDVTTTEIIHNIHDFVLDYSKVEVRELACFA